MTDIKVLVADDLSSTAVDVMKTGGIAVDVNVGLAPYQLAEIIGGYQGLAVRSATKVTGALLAQAASLKIVGRAGVGVDNIDVAAATERKVLVINTPQGNSVAAAELAIGLMFALARKIPQANSSMRKGEWEKKKFMGVELTGKTMGVVGLGNIGRQVAERAVGLKMKVMGHDPYLPPGKAPPPGVVVASLEDLLAQSDFVTLHLPLSPETKHLFGATTFARMKKGACLINAARGGVVDESALLDALAQGRLAGAAVDVFEQEPPGPIPLLAHENVIATPHLGASTKEAQQKVAVELAEVFVDYFKNGTIRNAVNKP
jgi:D-3-phosphoglycerate dehydrogenase